jgi:hypothetical protein
MAVEVFDAETMMLLTSGVGAAGRITIYEWGDAYAKELLIHVYGPTPAATFTYDLYVILGSGGEDECEC